MIHRNVGAGIVVLLIAGSTSSGQVVATRDCSDSFLFKVSAQGYNAHLGNAVAIDGDRAVAGALAHPFLGRAYVYRRFSMPPVPTVWVGLAVPPPPYIGVLDSHFGSSVAICGSEFVVGADKAFYPGPETGTAFVYRFTPPYHVELLQKLSPAVGSVMCHFGAAVAMNTEWIAVGCPGGIDGYGPGRVYVFRRNADVWTLDAQFTAPDARHSDGFGVALALDETRLVVGAPAAWKSNTQFVGAAYVFDLVDGHWVATERLSPPSEWVDTDCGASVALSGQTVIAGAPRFRVGDEFKGAALIFELQRGRWMTQAILFPDFALPYERFGDAVAVDGDSALIGASNADEAGVHGAGAVCVYTRRGDRWTQQAKFGSGDPGETDWFGWAVAMSGGRALVGCIRDDQLSPNAGAVYFIDDLACVPLSPD